MYSPSKKFHYNFHYSDYHTPPIAPSLWSSQFSVIYTCSHSNDSLISHITVLYNHIALMELLWWKFDLPALLIGFLPLLTKQYLHCYISLCCCSQAVIIDYASILFSFVPSLSLFTLSLIVTTILLPSLI